MTYLWCEHADVSLRVSGGDEFVVLGILHFLLMEI